MQPGVEISYSDRSENLLCWTVIFTLRSVPEGTPELETGSLDILPNVSIRRRRLDHLPIIRVSERKLTGLPATRPASTSLPSSGQAKGAATIRMAACRQDAGATRVLCRLALGGSGGGGGVDGGWDVDGLAVVEVAEVFNGFVDG